MQHGAGVGPKKSDARIPSASPATPFSTVFPRSLFRASHWLALTQEGPLVTSHLLALTQEGPDLPGLPRAVFAKGSVCTSTFLTGSGPQTESAVTHSKQTTAPFLTGSRFARLSKLLQRS